MQIVPKLPTASLRHRTDRVAIQETPILAFLGLGLFLWIFLTNSLPAKRDLAHRLAQVQLHAGEQGRLALLKEELSREESLAEAVREDPVVRQALYLHEHPTAKPNDPELLLLPMSFEHFPDDPDPIVEEWEVEGALPITESPSEEATVGDVPAVEIEPTGGRIVRGANAGHSTTRHAAANSVTTRQQQPPPQQQKPKSTNSRPPTPEGTKRLGTSKAEERPPQAKTDTRPTGRSTTSKPPAAKKPSGPGRFAVPNFLQG